MITKRSKDADFFDQAILEDLFAGHIWTPPGFPEFEHHCDAKSTDVVPGSVLVLPGAYHAKKLNLVNPLIDKARSSVLCIMEDEGSLFPWQELNVDRMPLWIQNPRGDVHDGSERGVPVGWTPATRETVKNHSGDKPLDWFFSGQVTHNRRKSCVRQLQSTPNGELHKTPGFLQGMEVEDYLRKMASCKIAPCPGGVITPDSFRVWEALEAGAIPLADVWGGRGRVENYWAGMLGEVPAFPLVEDWAGLPGIMTKMLGAWPFHSNRVQSWWGGWKRRFAHRFNDDLKAVGAEEKHRPGDRITVLMPTSPIPAHPSTAVIEETLSSVRSRPELAGCEIIIMCDGVREAQEDRKADYYEYIRRLQRLCRNIPNVWVKVFDEHTHQAGMTKETLTHVHTPTILFVEHDAPLIGHIPFENLVDAVLSEADVVRLHHETHVLDPHKYLMLDETPKEVAGVPMLRTVQWSQRPHVANTGFYRQILEEHFDLPREHWMIETRMYSIVFTAWREFKEAGWNSFRVWMYAPEGNIKRSTHLDGRGDAKSWETD